MESIEAIAFQIVHFKNALSILTVYYLFMSSSAFYDQFAHIGREILVGY